MNKKILIVTSEFPPQPGGIGNHAYNLAKHLDGEGMNVAVIADQRSASGKEEETFDGLLKFKVHRVRIRNMRLLMYVKRIILLFHLLKATDVVLASGKFSLWSVALASLFYKRRYVAVIHGSEVNFTNKSLKTTINASLKRFATIIAVSNYTKNLVASIHSDIVVIPNGIDSEQFKLNESQKIDIKGQPKLITVGNITDRKGQLTVINHLPELIKTYPKLHYHCVGLPTQKEAFLKIAKTLDVDTHITFHGRVSDSNLSSFLTSSDIFVMLSNATKTGDVEGFGIALIEANHFGLPCIGAKDCGIEDAIEDYKTGRLITHTNVDAFKAALEDILSNYESYQLHAKDWSSQHSWQLIVKRYINVLDL